MDDLGMPSACLLGIELLKWNYDPYSYEWNFSNWFEI